MQCWGRVQGNNKRNNRFFVSRSSCVSWTFQKEACKLLSDNDAVISISYNPVQHDRTKHVEIDRHFIKEKLEKQVISFPFVRSKDQLTSLQKQSQLKLLKILYASWSLEAWWPNLRGSVQKYIFKYILNILVSLFRV